MENKQPSLLSPRGQALELAYKLVREQLAKIGDLDEQCRKSDADRIEANKIVVDFLNQSYLITLPETKISLLGDEKEIPLKDKVLLLHYFTLAKGTSLTGKLITFKQLPGCASYAVVFDQLATNPLVSNFGKEPELLIDAAIPLGGHKANYGDVSVIINAFRKVPITIALWRGDDEFAPRGSVMFDSTINDYLSIEDIRDIGGIIARRLISFRKP